jgi:hypothetical protein
MGWESKVEAEGEATEFRRLLGLLKLLPWASAICRDLCAAGSR